MKTPSLYNRLTPDQRDLLFLELSETDGDLKKAAEICAEWGITASLPVVSRCYAKHFFAWKFERAKLAAAATEELGTWDAEANRLAAQKTFEQLASAKPDPKFVMMVRAYELAKRKVELAEKSAENRFQLERDKLALAERRVAIAEKKLTQAKSALNDEKLSPQEKEERLRRIFGA